MARLPVAWRAGRGWHVADGETAPLQVHGRYSVKGEVRIMDSPGGVDACATLPMSKEIDLLLERLNSKSASVRHRTAQALAALGHESTIPLLAEAIAREQDVGVRAELEHAAQRLESASPPTLHVMLMGGFRSSRGERAIAADAWQRPAAKRLFLYFVLHEGEALPRERVIEDLWADSSPTAARNSFKTVYCWMRKVIEPYLRPKSPMRYMQVDQETYTFNPTRSRALVRCDVIEFERSVRAALSAADAHDLHQMPAELIAALNGWQPPLTEWKDEPWAIAARERLQTLYVQGCLYAASAMLDMWKLLDATYWAERAIGAAPWSEEAWQVLIRAQARQGNRALALASYASAVVALQHELNAPPSSVSVWLAKRLQANEEI